MQDFIEDLLKKSTHCCAETWSINLPGDENVPEFKVDSDNIYTSWPVGVSLTLAWLFYSAGCQVDTAESSQVRNVVVIVDMN